MITKEQFRKEARFNNDEYEFVLLVYSKLFDKEIDLKVLPESTDRVHEKDGITNRFIAIWFHTHWTLMMKSITMGQYRKKNIMLQIKKGNDNYLKYTTKMIVGIR